MRGARADQPAGAFGGDPRYVLAALLSIAAFVFGAVLYNHWERLLLFRYSRPFGTSEPVFGRTLPRPALAPGAPGATGAPDPRPARR